MDVKEKKTLMQMWDHMINPYEHLAPPKAPKPESPPSAGKELIKIYGSNITEAVEKLKLKIMK